MMSERSAKPRGLLGRRAAGGFDLDAVEGACCLKRNLQRRGIGCDAALVSERRRRQAMERARLRRERRVEQGRAVANAARNRMIDRHAEENFARVRPRRRAATAWLEGEEACQRSRLTD